MYCKCPDGLFGRLCTEKETASRAESIMWIYLLLILVGLLVFFGYILYNHQTKKYAKATHDHDPVETIPEDEVLYNGNIT